MRGRGLELFDFVEEHRRQHPLESGWGKLMTEWNRRVRLAWRYTDRRNFRRDFIAVHLAYYDGNPDAFALHSGFGLDPACEVRDGSQPLESSNASRACSELAASRPSGP